jgi:ribosomal protein L6P/L9E
MSRIGKKPIVIPDGVNVEIADGRVTVSKGQER